MVDVFVYTPIDIFVYFLFFLFSFFLYVIFYHYGNITLHSVTERYKLRHIVHQLDTPFIPCFAIYGNFHVSAFC